MTLDLRPAHGIAPWMDYLTLRSGYTETLSLARAKHPHRQGIGLAGIELAFEEGAVPMLRGREALYVFTEIIDRVNDDDPRSPNLLPATHAAAAGVRK